MLESGPGGVDNPLFKPTESTPGIGPSSPSGGLSEAMKTPVSSLGELKSLLLDKMGEEQGQKFYDNFLKSFLMMMLGQTQQASQRAREAAKEMRKPR